MAEHRDFFNQHKPKSTTGIVDNILQVLPSDKHGTAIDLCCGTGHLVYQLTQQGYQAIGVDIADAHMGKDDAVEQAFIVADVAATPLAAKSATLVTFIDSLQYFEDPQHMIDETARLLSKDGYLIMSCQNNYNLAGIKKWLIQRLTGKTWSPWLVHPVENFLLYPDIITMLEASGYTVEYVRGKQFLTAWVSLLPAFVRHWTPWRDKPWRSLAAIASRVSLPTFIEESYLARFAMITLIRARKN